MRERAEGESSASEPEGAPRAPRGEREGMRGRAGGELSGSDLAVALADSLGPVTIEGLTLLSGGASRQTWAFDAVRTDGSRSELVLRRDPPGRPSEPGAMAREARAIGAARGAGLAVPDVLACGEGAQPWGTAGMIMRRVAGETIARRILRDDAYRPARRVLVGQLGEFAARLHALDLPSDLLAPEPLADLRAALEAPGQPAGGFPGVASPDQDGGRLRAIEGSGVPPGQQSAPLGQDAGGLLGLAPPDQRSAVFERALATLAADPPPARGPVLVHGDLRLGNLIVGPDGLRAVIDWELAHVGNPAEDLGWLCVKAWRFGVDAPVGGMGTREELLAAYRAAGGADISVDELRWWEVLSTLRWGVICLAQAWTHLSGAHRSVELAAIGRRVCEQEWDLLLLLEPQAATRAAADMAAWAAASGPGDAPVPAPHGRPTAGELLDAVREFLVGQVMPATGGQLAFHARVAANVLGIVAREIDAGRLPPTDDLAANVAARLAVANPRYFDVTPPAD